MARVLVADADPLTVQVMRDFLSDCGHQVTCASSGEEALALGRAAPADVLICDYALRDLDGPSLARRLQVRDPEMRVLVATGHSSTRVQAAARRVRNLRVLAKPLDLDTLEASLSDPAAGPKEW